MYAVRPTLTELDLGRRGWRVVHEDARRLGRRPNAQALALIRWALKQRLDGKNTELTPSQLDRLLSRAEQLEPVA